MRFQRIPQNGRIQRLHVSLGSASSLLRVHAAMGACYVPVSVQVHSWFFHTRFPLMFHAHVLSGTKPEQYRQLLEQARALLHGEHDRIANAANLSALVYHALPQLNWVGFYFFDGTELVVGPFQGKPACVRIPLGRGVCGTAAVSRQVQCIEDVFAFDDHIACDSDSRSELVIPLVVGERLIGVLDLDSPVPARFDGDDADGLTAIAGVFLEALR